MAMVRSAMAWVARSHQPASLPARAASELSLPSAGCRRPAADHMTKRYLSDGKSECGLVGNLRQKYFKVDGCYHQADSSILMLHTANGIDALSKDLTALKRKALVPAVCITTFFGVMCWHSYTLQKNLEIQKKKCSEIQNEIEDLFDRASAVGITFPIHIRLPRDVHHKGKLNDESVH
ncbi:uncharacterized protein LOC124677919 [Lolium rigidum]|uniref:uncharacterized protein LOC124677919 n=1 Tax=Lolium rigidum TaxID=89674 RepID=UPI001F5D620D|nr:uncharacterized protein LOC124677919 [Lolium rigidum]